MPQSICHQDLVASNIVLKTDPNAIRYSLIDWSTFGHAPIGAELAPLLIGNALLLRWSLEASLAITPKVIDAYRDGLSSNGLSVTTVQIRFSLFASAALRYIAWGGHRIESVINPKRRHLARSVTGHSIEDLMTSYTAVRRHVTTWGFAALGEIREARSLNPTGKSE